MEFCSLPWTVALQFEVGQTYADCGLFASSNISLFLDPVCLYNMNISENLTF